MSGFSLLGYEIRKSAGWEYSPYFTRTWLGSFGFSSYITRTQGRSGMLYVFTGKELDTANLLGAAYYGGIGLNLSNIASFEVQLETLGIGAQVALGNFSVSADANLLGELSITLGWDTDLGNGVTRTDGFTIGVNPRIAVVLLWVYRVVTTGDTSPLPGLVPA